MTDVRQIDGASFATHLPALAGILADAVDGAASVGFVWPFTVANAESWWSTLEPEVAAGRIVLLGAFQDGALVGTVQLRLAAYPNARHVLLARDRLGPTLLELLLIHLLEERGELFEGQRLDQVMFEACLARTVPVRFLPIACQRDQANTRMARGKPAGHLISVDNRQP